MDKTSNQRLKLSAFFDNDDDEQTFTQKPVDNAKLSQYHSGNHRKTRREKEQEAAEAKKREEEADQARALSEFLETFEGEGGGKRSAVSSFVKADDGRGSSTASAAFSKPLPTGPSGSRTHHTRSPSPGPSHPPRPRGKRAMDSFLEEIKREQAEREVKYSRHAGTGKSVTALAAYDSQSGSKDRGDSLTTNVFVSNLPPHVTVPTLGNLFAKAGSVGSVKIMWPRTDGPVGSGVDPTASRKSQSSSLSGFVSFMQREGAEEALRQFDGFEWGGCVLRVGWSKAVPVAARPMFVSNSHRRSRSNSPAPRGHRRSRSRSRSPFPRNSGRRSRSPSPPDEEDDVTDTFVRAVAAEVKGQGPQYGTSLLERERSNSKYAFMRPSNRMNSYYRGLIDDMRTDGPEFNDDGYNSVYSTDSEEESEREHGRKNQLGKLARRRFEAMLRAMSGKKGELARCMAFCLDHAEAANEVADIIVASLLVDSTPVPRKVSRLHLICDILHNSAAPVPSAWKFRQEFQGRLGLVFDHMANIYHSFPGRITADIFKKQITSIVDIWEDWLVFPHEFTTELRKRLDGDRVDETDNTQKASAPSETVTVDAEPSFTSRFKTSTFQAASTVDNEVVMEEDVDGAPIDDDGDIDGAVMQEDDVDGAPMQEDDLDGEPISDQDIYGAPIEDIDGESLDGEPMNDDLDGEPMKP